jgi:hypothetical protein
MIILTFPVMISLLAFIKRTLNITQKLQVAIFIVQLAISAFFNITIVLQTVFFWILHIHIHVSKSHTDLATPVNCLPSWHNGLGLLFATSLQVPILFRNYACGEYTLLLCPNNQFYVCEQSSAADPSCY